MKSKLLLESLILKFLHSNSTHYSSEMLDHFLRLAYIYGKPFHSLVRAQYTQVSILILAFISFIFESSNEALSSLDSTGFTPFDVSSHIFSLPILSIKTIVPLLIFLLLLKNKCNLKFFLFEVVLLVLFLLASLKTFFSFNPLVSGIWLAKFAYAILIYLLISRLKFSLKELTIFSYAAVLILLAESGLTLLQYMNGGLIGFSFEQIWQISANSYNLNINENQVFRTVGTFSHPNLLSLYLALSTPFAILLLFEKKLLIKILAGLALGISFMANLSTLSRWGLLTQLFALLISVVTLSIYKHLKLKKHLYLLLFKFLIILALILFLFFSPLLSRFTELPIDDRSLATRTHLLNQSLFVFRNEPFGIGPGAFMPYFANFDVTNNKLSNRFLRPVHSLYMILSNEIGIQGLVVFIIFLFELIRFYISRLKKLPIKLQLFGLLLFVFVLTYLFNGLLEPRTLTGGFALAFFLILGLTISVITTKTN